MGKRHSELSKEATAVAYKIKQGTGDTVRVTIDDRDYTPQEICHDSSK